MASSVPDISATLCERCGYVIDGLDEGANCPECGLPTWESHSERRPGTPWQQQVSPAALAAVVYQLHVSPRRLFRTMRAGETADRALLWTSVCLSVLSVAVIVVFMGSLFGNRPLGRMLAMGGVLAAVCTVVTVVLSWIEMRGVVFFSTKRGWRVPRSLALAIIAHCAPAWVWAWAGAAAGHLTAPWLERPLRAQLANTVFDSLLPASVPVLGFVIGMLAFESLVYLGVRECRHANAFRTNTPR